MTTQDRIKQIANAAELERITDQIRAANDMINIGKFNLKVSDAKKIINEELEALEALKATMITNEDVSADC